MKQIFLILFIFVITGCSNKKISIDKIYINNLNIKETGSSYEESFQKKETPFFALTDNNSTIGGVFTFDGDNINGYVLVDNEKNNEKFNNVKKLFDCETNNSIIKPSFIVKSGELESELTAILDHRCFYYQ